MADGVAVHARTHARHRYRLYATDWAAARHNTTQHANVGRAPLRVAACLLGCPTACTAQHTARTMQPRTPPGGSPPRSTAAAAAPFSVPVSLGGPKGPDGRAGTRAHEAAAVPSLSFDLTVVTSAGGKICRGLHDAPQCNGMRSDATEGNGRRRCAPIANGIAACRLALKTSSSTRSH